MIALAASAWACGGLMCDAGPTPVVQEAEQIAFWIDEDAGMVEAHVRIDYAGPPDAFAWVVPIAAQPEVFLASEQLFTTIDRAMAPQVQLLRVTEGTCRGEGGCFGAEFASARSPDASDTGFVVSDTDEVTVVAQGQVGPYDHVVLTATGETELVEWLQDNGYAVPDGLAPALAPYVVPGGHFVAVRLTKDSDTGSIAPLGFRYPADAASIPIQLTAIATAPDLPLQATVFGAHRAVPESYLHVAINEANLDWFGGGQNYYDVVSAAADQAGGHAFATDFAGNPADVVATALWSDRHEDLAAAMAGEGDPVSWAGLALDAAPFPADAGLIAALSPWITVSAGEDWWTPARQLASADLPEATARMEAYVFEPLRRSQRLLDQPWASRLSSSLDAAEMTVDPVFVLNPDLGPVSNLHVATLVTDCRGNSALRDDAPRRLELEDGRVYALPSFVETGFDDSGFWAGKRSDVEALRVEITGRRGLPEIVVDLTEDLRRQADGSSDGCGCRSAPVGSTALALVLGLGVLGRRRPS